jgi:hypothetical protein
MVALFAGAAAAFDMAELVHQVEQSATGLAVLASVIAGVHLAACSSAAFGAISRRPNGDPAVEMRAA